MLEFIDREAARAAILEMGIPLGRTALANLANRGTGPAYVIINGRALYKSESILAWVREQSEKPNLRLRPRAA